MHTSRLSICTMRSGWGRWPVSHGKRGGSRVIYYHFTAASQIALLLIYPKNEKDDLTADERKVLKQIIERWR